MIQRHLRLAFVAFTTTAVLGCSSSSSSTNPAPVIDDLEMPDTAGPITVSGQSLTGVTGTITAHATDSGLTTLHFVFTETGTDTTVQIPGAPSSVDKLAFVLALAAPSGAHPVQIRVTDAHGVDSAVLAKTIHVP